MAVDDFDRADDPELGPDWIPMSGISPGSGVEITGNEAEILSTGDLAAERYAADTPPDDQFSEVILGSVIEEQLDKGCGPSWRMSASEGTFYFLWVNLDSSGEYQYGKCVADALTYLGAYSAGAVPTPGRAVEGRSVGTTQSVWVDGIEVASVTDAAIASGNCGISGIGWMNAPTLASWQGGSTVEEEQEASLTWLVPIDVA